MEIQRQSDAQDQQFREQQSAPQQQYYQPQQSYGSNDYGRSSVSSSRRIPARTSPPPSPMVAAFQRGDFATVLRILRPKALAGDPGAQHNLGYMYEKGYGLPHNGAVAASWYQKSANQGNPDGQLALGRLYFEGDGVARNLVEAYKWMYLAGRGTSKAFAYLRVIGNMLTYDQMNEAMHLAQTWNPVRHR
jgi:TPR repeat protein